MFKSVFYDQSLAFLPLAAQLPGAILSDAFWEGFDAAKKLANTVLCDLPNATPLATLQQAMESLNMGGGLMHGGSGAWMCAEIPKTKLHVTLVPPATKASISQEEGAAERTAAMKRLKAYAGHKVTVTLLRYHLAQSRPGGEDGGRGGRGGRGRGRSGLVTPERQCGFWEVGALVGLPEEAQLATQREVYHVTDLASLIGCAPRESNEVLRGLRRGDLAPEWEATVLRGVADYEMGEGATAAKEVGAQVRVFS